MAWNNKPTSLIRYLDPVMLAKKWGYKLIKDIR